MEAVGKLDLITIIVEKGEAERAIKAAIDQGAQGATMFFARGTGVRQRLGQLGALINPEKEVILVVTPRDLTNQVFDAAIKAAKLDKPGRGFAYVQEISRAVGFLKTSST